jgi:hypothetical protein
MINIMKEIISIVNLLFVNPQFDSHDIRSDNFPNKVEHPSLSKGS